MVAALRVLALVAVLAFPAAAGAADFPPGSESGFDGAVSATLSWTGGPDGPTHTTLTISRGGAVAFAQPIDDIVCGACELDRHSDLFVIDLNGDGEAEVLVSTFTGGEFCCRMLGVFGHRPDGTYNSFLQNWGDAGYDIGDVDGDGVFEIISRDTAFVDVFESGALSYSPAQVVHYGLRKGEPYLFDVTRRYPSEIRRNATHARYLARRVRHHARGYVAAYVADQYLLGHGATGLRELDREIRRGSVGSPGSARAYRKRLLRFLHQLGYR